MPVTPATELKYVLDEGVQVDRIPRRAFSGAGGSVLEIPLPRYGGVAEVVDMSVHGRSSAAELLRAYRQMHRIDEGADKPPARVTQMPRWRREALDDLARNLERVDDDQPMSAEFVFLAALDSAHVASFKARAEKLLQDGVTTRSSWNAFVAAEARAAEGHIAHDWLPPLDEESQSAATSEHLDTQLLTLADLRARISRGAMRGPRLIDVSDV